MGASFWPFPAHRPTIFAGFVQKMRPTAMMALGIGNWGEGRRMRLLAMRGGNYLAREADEAFPGKAPNSAIRFWQRFMNEPNCWQPMARRGCAGHSALALALAHTCGG